ncbi:MAG TPA: hypothetical protein VGH27_35595, partial [Streptosporangiaceae bacterium]
RPGHAQKRDPRYVSGRPGADRPMAPRTTYRTLLPRRSQRIPVGHGQTEALKQLSDTVDHEMTKPSQALAAAVTRLTEPITDGQNADCEDRSKCSAAAAR